MESVEQRGIDFSVTFGQNEQWHVTTQECPKPLASFKNPKTACEWAIQRAKPVRGRVWIGEVPVVVE